MTSAATCINSARRFCKIGKKSVCLMTLCLFVFLFKNSFFKLQSEYHQFNKPIHERRLQAFKIDQYVTVPKNISNVRIRPKNEVKPVKELNGVNDIQCYASNECQRLKPLPPKKLKARGCQRRLPDALIVGVKKAGTSALKSFLCFHPEVIASHFELHYFDVRYFLGIEWYTSNLPYATANQKVLEKTPKYFIYPDVPRRICDDISPNVKIIIILRDPVTRAISDYVHEDESRERKKVEGEREDRLTPQLSPEMEALKNIHKKIDRQNIEMAGLNIYSKLGDTFESSVVDANGDVIRTNAIVDSSIYVTHILRWMEYFPRNQILILDGDAFIKDPVPALQQVESFLGVKSYFSRDNFYFDEEKRFYCVSKPEKSCMPKVKGRPHPNINPKVLKKLREFYKPYDRWLVEVTGQNFTWMAYDKEF
ncbi:heparan sulfate glucosamine 3-O-sulfotransferase 1-like [Anneissia japonica]|uniref:heparan sulfate glucosamine 3-O-sulfotransferase 1-like n=1 Tax=Anneissia japonica TaxID=1529436 RepID=UPI001425B9CA|nr:heparan sulfate glucosamine 3-O-sulfotransferase 1-like [Anneissia japonica]